MAKAPAFQFYVGDYLQDTRCLSLAARGAWVDLLCVMWRSEIKGEISFTLEGYARLFGCSSEQAQAIVEELTRFGFIRQFNGAKMKLVNTWIRSRRNCRHRPPIPKRVKDIVLAVGKCAKCGSSKNLTIDHVIPYSKGGAHNINNFQCLCWKCNRDKSDKIGGQN